MKLSSDTMSILKNFGVINQGILFKKGKNLKTISPLKTILAEVTITEEIPSDFGVYDLNNFLSVVSLHKDDPSFEFDDKHVVIVGNKGRSKIKYRFCDPQMITLPPEKQINLPEVDIEFDLSAEDFDWILRAANVLSSPHVAVESDGKKVNLVALDLQNDSAHTDSLEVSKGNGDKFRMLFKTENLAKLLPGTYKVFISSKGISLFDNEKMKLRYWVTTESGSTFTKSK